MPVRYGIGNMLEIHIHLRILRGCQDKCKEVRLQLVGEGHKYMPYADQTKYLECYSWTRKYVEQVLSILVRCLVLRLLVYAYLDQTLVYCRHKAVMLSLEAWPRPRGQNGWPRPRGSWTRPRPRGPLASTSDVRPRASRTDEASCVII